MVLRTGYRFFKENRMSHQKASLKSVVQDIKKSFNKIKPFTTRMSFVAYLKNMKKIIDEMYDVFNEEFERSRNQF